jgi:hypothetical protein
MGTWREMRIWRANKPPPGLAVPTGAYGCVAMRFGGKQVRHSHRDWALICEQRQRIGRVFVLRCFGKSQTKTVCVRF